MGYYSTAGLTSAVNLPVVIHTAESSKALSEKCLVQEHSTVAASRLEPAGPLDTESKALSTRKLGLPYIVTHHEILRDSLLSHKQ